jgi:hypothetical protein
VKSFLELKTPLRLAGWVWKTAFSGQDCTRVANLQPENDL